MNSARRYFLKAIFLVWGVLTLTPWFRRGAWAGVGRSAPDAAQQRLPLGVEPDGRSLVTLVRNGSPEANVQKAVELMGGIQKFVGSDDIVVLKPNAQWWNQGMTNTDAMKGFIDMVLGIPDFSGEIIIADNHQFAGDDSRGWNTTQRNGTYNYDELVQYYQNNGHANVSKYHWRVAGTAEIPLQGDAQGNKRVNGPGDGDGYVWMEDCCYISPAGDKCLMTYPVFTSSYSGVTVDLKNGPWRNGEYLQGKKVKFINFSALNHHGRYCGVTASVKNYMGVVDMTCGFPGDKPDGTYNVHHIGVSKKIGMLKNPLFSRMIKFKYKFEDFCTRNFHYTGGALGVFMKEVRMADLNIITAEQVGWGHRTKPEKSFRARTVLASCDPVALDYLAAREVLLPGTPPDERRPESGLRYYDLNNPDIKDGPFHRFLAETHRQGVGNLAPGKMKLVVYDLNPTASS